MVYFTIGTDLEVFGKVGHKHVALCGKIGGTKEAPRQLEGMPSGFMVQEDNVSLEFNIPPSDNIYDFSNHVDAMAGKVRTILSSLGLEPSTHAAVSFDTQELTHPNALVFGCEPDYNAWTKRENEKPHAKDKNLRTAGGHIHVGTGEIDMLDGIRAMDLYLGVPSVILDDSPASVLRRELYGKAGAMRPKPYGFEYRTLSNFWMFDPRLTQWVFNNTALAMDRVFNQKAHRNQLTVAEGEVIQRCINTGDKALAKELIDKYNIPMPAATVKTRVRRPNFDDYVASRTVKNVAGLSWTVAPPPPPPPLEFVPTNGVVVGDTTA